MKGCILKEITESPTTVQESYFRFDKIIIWFSITHFPIEAYACIENTPREQCIDSIVFSPRVAVKPSQASHIGTEIKIGQKGCL